MDNTEVVCRRLFKGTAILKEQFSIKEQAKQLSEKAKNNGITSKKLSEWRNYTSKSRKPNVPLLEKTVKVMEEWLKETFQRVWSDIETDYIYSDTTIRKSDDESIHESHKAAQLEGSWVGYSYNKLKGQRLQKPNEDSVPFYINISQIKISADRKVECRTQKGTMFGSVEIFKNTRLILELKSFNRKITVYGDIGLYERLSDLHVISFAYVDTGFKKIKCGLILIKRHSILIDPDIQTEGFLADEIEDLSSTEKNFLKQSQLVANDL